MRVHVHAYACLRVHLFFVIYQSTYLSTSLDTIGIAGTILIDLSKGVDSELDRDHERAFGRLREAFEACKL